MLEIIMVCPLGNKCEEIKDNKIYRCNWYVELKGKDPQSEQDISEWRCAIAWNSILQIEIAQTNRGQTQAIEIMRNETIKRQDIFNAIALNNSKVKQIKNKGDNQLDVCINS